MNEKERLLVNDLCERLSYDVKLYNKQTKVTVFLSEFSPLPNETPLNLIKRLVRDGWIPYLRPMSSMSDKEKNDYAILLRWLNNVQDMSLVPWTCMSMISWLRANHFDYNELLKKELAIEAPNGTYE